MEEILILSKEDLVIILEMIDFVETTEILEEEEQSLKERISAHLAKYDS